MTNPTRRKLSAGRKSAKSFGMHTSPDFCFVGGAAESGVAGKMRTLRLQGAEADFHVSLLRESGGWHHAVRACFLVYSAVAWRCACELCNVFVGVVFWLTVSLCVFSLLLRRSGSSDIRAPSVVSDGPALFFFFLHVATTPTS